MKDYDERERKLDDELARLTDRLLAQPTSADSDADRDDYAVMIRGLQTALHEEPSAVFRQRLDQRLDQEWTRRSTQPTARRMRFSPVMRMVAAAAVLVVGISVLTLVTPPTADAVQGTAVGEFGTGIVLGLGMLIVVGIAAWVGLRRR